MIDGASVSAEVLDQKRGRKIIVFKKKRRKNYRRKKGHRQELTKVSKVSAASDEVISGLKVVDELLEELIQDVADVSGANQPSPETPK